MKQARGPTGLFDVMLQASAVPMRDPSGDTVELLQCASSLEADAPLHGLIAVEPQPLQLALAYLQR